MRVRGFCGIHCGSACRRARLAGELLARQHLDSYLDEFSFRFNRRASRKRGLVFYRLLQQCLHTRPLGYEDIVFSRRPERGAVRGPTPQLRRRATAKEPTP